MRGDGMSSNVDLVNVDLDSVKIVDERDPVYGKTWQKMKIKHILDEIHQKADRIEMMPDGPAKYEQAIDLVNYGRFLAWRVRMLQ